MSDAADTPIDPASLPRWNLDDLYTGPQDPQFQADLDQAAEQATAFARRWRGKLDAIAPGPDGGEQLAAAVAEIEALSDLMGKIASYAMLYHVGDTTDAERSRFFGDVQAKLTSIHTGLLFFELELNRISDDTMASALKSAALDRYRPWIEDLRKDRPYQLDDKIEELFSEKSLTGASAFNRLFDQTMAALEFDVDGEALSLEPALNLLVSPDGAKRKSAADALSRTFKDNIPLFTLITNTLAKDKEISDRWRGFEDVAASRHLANRVEPEVVDALAAAVTAAYPKLSHRYYTMKAHWLGKDRLDHWDRNAPLPSADSRIIGWDEARSTVLDAYAGFSPQMAGIAKQFFDKSWIDAPVQPGKSPGAFAHPTVPSAHPYVMLNYQGRIRDVMTLAHELGHGVHQVLAGKQGALMAPTPLTLAETASVFGEMLTFQSLLAKTSDATARKNLLASKVEDMLNTVVRQIAFYNFERKVHEQCRKGELTPDRIGQLWLDTQTQSLGPAIRFGPGYENFWCYVPHFIHAPFYVYAYAFGDCLVNSLYARYRAAESGFQDKYFDLLKAGGSKSYSELLKPFDLDAKDPAFWQMGLAMIESLINEIEELDHSA